MSGAVLLVFVLLTVTFVLLAIGATAATTPTVAHWGGYIGIATAARALVCLVRRGRQQHVREDRSCPLFPLNR